MATVLAQSPDFVAHRNGRYFVVTLVTSHQVLATSEFNGGLSNTTDYLVNHQSMESNADQRQADKILNLNPEQYHALIASELELPPESMAMMSTAASMNHIAYVKHTFQDLQVSAFVTAGVYGNALRAGDPARWFAGEHGNKAVAQAGTINTLVLINKPMLAGALVKATTIMSEAKSAVLTELAIPSTESSHIATGTGTDQLIVAAPEHANTKPLVSASGHLKLGELIGSCVREATLEALRWQNALERSKTQSVVHAIGRFGLTESRLFETLKVKLSAESYALLNNNRHSILTEPRVVAAVYAYAAVLDRIQYGTLSTTLATTALKDQAANIAVGVSSRTALWSDFWQKITINLDDSVETIISAIALGWEAKWHD